MKIDKEESSLAKSLRDALKSEVANEPRGKTHYKIYRIETDEKTGKKKSITMTKFWADDDAEAYEKLKEYQKTASEDCTYYYGTTGYYIGNSLDENGKVRRYDSLTEMMDDEEARRPLGKKIKEALIRPFSVIHDKVEDAWYGVRNFVYWMKHKHRRSESWSLDHHLVEDLMFNIPKLIKDKYGVPTSFCVKARKELNKDNPDFDADKSFTANPNFDLKEMDLASRLWDAELERGLLYAKLWLFYSHFGIVDDKEFEERWKSTIPYMPGTDHEIDYLKLQELEDQNWNSLWKWVAEHGRNLCV